MKSRLLHAVEQDEPGIELIHIHTVKLKDKEGQNMFFLDHHLFDRPGVLGFCFAKVKGFKNTISTSIVYDTKTIGQPEDDPRSQFKRTESGILVIR
jgi:hypothetical protein